MECTTVKLIFEGHNLDVDMTTVPDGPCKPCKAICCNFLGPVCGCDSENCVDNLPDVVSRMEHLHAYTTHEKHLTARRLINFLESMPSETEIVIGHSDTLFQVTAIYKAGSKDGKEEMIMLDLEEVDLS